MAYDEGLAQRIREALSDRSDVVEKKMFGGLCFMVGGAMCCGLTKTDFMVRVGSAGYADALAQPHVRPMDFTGRPLKGLVYVASAEIASDAGLSSWVALGVASAGEKRAGASGSSDRRAAKPPPGRRSGAGSRAGRKRSS